MPLPEAQDLVEAEAALSLLRERSVAENRKEDREALNRMGRTQDRYKKGHDSEKLKKCQDLWIPLYSLTHPCTEQPMVKGVVLLSVLPALDEAISAINSLVWGPLMLALLFGTHIFLTIRLGFIQRFIPLGIRISLKKDSATGDVSQGGALATALAATVGTGNIVGVATAVGAGGPGAVLWMWLTGVFGIATKYAEALLAVRYRELDEKGNVVGGPMFVLEKGLGMKWAGVLFAIFTVIASFGIGNMVQAHSISDLLSEKAGISPYITGGVLATLTALVIIGGLRRIAGVCQALVPLMALIYVVSSIVLLVLGWRTLPDTIRLIFESAFTGQAAVGGFIGAGMRETIRYGLARGLFSNESGMGSAPIVAAAAKTRNPVRQALVSATGTFWDTVVICALTGLVLVNSGVWQSGEKGAPLTAMAFERLGPVGPALLSVCLLLFVFSTIIGWSYYGERALEYLAGVKSLMVFRIIWVIVVFVGAVTELRLVWNFADTANALMAVPNLLALLLLSGVAVTETRRWLWSGQIDEEDPRL